MDSYVLEKSALLALLKQMQTSIQKFDITVAEISRQHPCWTIVQSLPGAGRSWRLACSRPWETAIDTRMLMKCSAPPALHQ